MTGRGLGGVPMIARSLQERTLPSGAVPGIGDVGVGGGIHDAETGW